MNWEHYNCHVCGDKYKYLYYKNYEELEKHFDKTHYLCPEPFCWASNYVVFKTPEELTLHTYTKH